MIRLTRRGDDPEAVGAAVARALLEGGGAAIEGFDGSGGRRAVTVYLVGAGPGDPGLLTRRGAALLARADVVLHDRLVSPAVLDLVPPSALVIDVGKDPDTPAGGAGRQEEIARLLVEHGRASARRGPPEGRRPVPLRPRRRGGGGAGRAGLAWEVVPGVTSAFGVPAAAGIPVTQRGVAASVTVVTGRVGEPDGTERARLGGPGPRRRDAGDPHGHDDPGRHRRRVGAGRAGARHAGRGDRQGTTASQRVARTTLAGLADVDLGPPAVIVVGPVAALGPHAATAAARRGPSGRSHRGGDARRRTRPGPGGRARAGGRHRARVAADPSGRPGGRRRRAAGRRGGRAGQRLGRADLGQRGGPLHGRAARRRAPSARVLVAAVGPATADALRRAGVEPDLVPAEHSARGLVEAFPDRAGARFAARAVPRAPTWRPAPFPKGSARRAGTSAASRPTAPSRAPHPSRRCWTGWPRPTP